MGRTWMDSFQAFLMSPRWRAVQNEVIARDGGLCVNCGSAEDLEVHRYSYNRWWTADYCETRCHDCVLAWWAEHRRRVKAWMSAHFGPSEA